MIKSGVQIFIFLLLKYITANGSLSQYGIYINQCGREFRDPCGITGTWKNDLGSFIDISCENGFLHGKYRIPVGKAEDVYELYGKYIMTGANQKDSVIAFLVPWNNASSSGNLDSTTSYTGIYYKSEDVIYTHWIVTEYMERDSLWRTNLIGHTDFRRI